MSDYADCMPVFAAHVLMTAANDHASLTKSFTHRSEHEFQSPILQCSHLLPAQAVPAAEVSHIQIGFIKGASCKVGVISRKHSPCLRTCSRVPE